jgi:chemotaxis protein MotB
MKKLFIVAALAPLLWTGCVSKKKYNEQVNSLLLLKKNYEMTLLDLQNCKEDTDRLKDRIKQLEAEVADLKANSNAMLNQLADLSVITREQAESIRKSIENLNSKDAYIKDLQVAMAKKDSLNMALVLNLKKALIDENDQDVEVKVEGSAVFISLSDKMLFRSGSYEISAAAKQILGKVARVLNAQPEIQIMVEGHTDNRPIRTEFVKDNWDLSVLRATSVVRSLQTEFKITPDRMVAAGRSEYKPISANDTDANRQANRRTRIVILPQLDQFFKLLEAK